MTRRSLPRLALCALALGGLTRPISAQQASVCTIVQISLGQQAALEREAFNAHLDLSNNQTDQPLTNLSVTITIKDSNGNSADAFFFNKVTNLTSVSAVDGTGTVQPSTQAGIDWLIIPSTGAGGAQPSGISYSVSAQISYIAAGVPSTNATLPATITVFPQPSLNLEYALPFEVFSVDPFTLTGTTVPFPLGLRVTNVGYGTANNFQITSGQPVITDDRQGLPITFQILGTFVGSNALPNNTFTIPYGDLAPGGSSLAAWEMTSSFSGRFTTFSATFTHASELGGALTSLIQSVTTYTLIKDVIDDQPGHDQQFDLLVNTTIPRDQLEARYQSGLEAAPDSIMESDRPGFTPVGNVSAHLTGALSGYSGVLTLAFDYTPAPNAWVHASIPFVQGSSVTLLSAVRSDGKIINPRNAWITPHIDKTTDARTYFLHILDYAPAQAVTYALTFNISSLQTPPDPITNLSVGAAVPGGVLLNWNATGAAGSSGTIVGGGYAIFASTNLAAVPSAGAAFVAFSTATPALAGQSYAVTGLLGNTTYQVAVFLANSGGQFSGASNSALALTLADPPIAVQVTTVTVASFALAWSTAANGPGTLYQLAPSSVAGASFTPSLSGFAADLSSAAFIGLSPNTSYFVSAAERNSAQVVTPSVVIATVATLAAPPTPAATPVVTVSSSSLSVQWQYGADPADTEFLAELSTAPDLTPANFTSGWVRALSFIFGGLAGQTTYYARVKARNRSAIETAYAELGAGRTSAFAILPPLGSPGSAFSLTGAAFGPFAGGSTRVRFGVGGSTAAITSWTNARINGIVPNLPTGAYSVLVERQNGAVVETLNGGPFTLLPAAPPTGMVVTLSPADGDQITISTPTIEADYAAALGVDTTSVHLRLDGAAVAAAVGPGSATFTPAAALTEGAHTVTASVADLSAAVTTATATFLVDTIAPVTTLAVDGLTQSATTLTLVSTDTLSLAATDAGSGVADTAYLLDVDPNTCDFSAYDGNAAPGTCANPYYSGPFSLSTGSHTLAFYSDDAAGNSEDYTHVVLSVTSPLYTAVSADGVASLRSPLSGETISAVAVSSQPAAAAALAQLLTPATSFYDLEPSGVAFAPAAALSFQFNPGTATPSGLAIYTFNGVAWTSAPISGQAVTVLSSSSVLMSGSLPHASLYGVFGHITSPTAASLSVTSLTPSSATTGGSLSLAASGTGFDASASLSLEHFRVAGGTWAAAASMMAARQGGSFAVLHDGRVLAAGGSDSVGASLASAELYDPVAGTWSAAATMASARAGGTLVVMNDGRVLAAGGRASSGDDLAQAEIYDPATGAWTAANPMLYAQEQALTALLPDGRVLLAGGYIHAGDQHLAAVQIYDPVAGTWSAGPTMLNARSGGAITVLKNGRILAAGGYNNGAVAAAEVFDPGSNAWTAAGSMSAGRYGQGQTLLGDGRVIAVGGNQVGILLDSCEFYDPATNAWTPAPSMSVARAPYQQTLTVNGRAVAIGGDYAGGFSATVEVYEPAANVWRLVAPLSKGRSGTMPLQLNDGRVLVAGGSSGSYASRAAEASVELLTMPVSMVAATAVAVADAQHLSGSVNLTGAATGYWDAVVRESGGRVGRLGAGLRVVVNDSTPPQTTIAFSTPSFVSSGTIVAIATRSSVTLTAVDPSSGTGVAATYYAVDSSTPAVIYTGPFMLSSGTHTVYYRSVDLAGNQEAISSATVGVYDGPFAGAVIPSSGPIGVSVSLAGFNFGAYSGSKSELLFGVSTAPISVWNDAQITATVPGVSTGTYALTIQALLGGTTTTASAGSFGVLAPQILTVVPSSGPIGLQFTLTGQAFGAYNGANTQVLLGGATVPISVWNDTRIVGTVPGVLSPGSYPVQVQRKATGGTVLSNSVNFDVVGLGLASVTPSTGPIGITFNLAGSGFGTYNGGNTQVLIGGTTAAISVWNDTSIQGTIPALSTGTYPVTVERLQGSGVALSNVATFTVTALTLAAPVPSSGPIAVAFTLAGTGFGAYNGANTRLLMGGATVAVSVWNDTTITGTVPTLSTGPRATWIERLTGGGLESSNTVYFQVVAPAVATVFPSSGPIGTSFTLSGSGFGTYNGANTQLLLGGTTTPISVWNDTTITATVPGTLSTGSVSVVVERIGADGGVSLSTPAAFLVIAPNSAGITPSTGPIGIVYTVNGSGFGAYNGANTQLLIGGTTTAISVWNDGKIQGTIPPLSSGSYTVVVERIQGAGTSLTTVATFMVTALALSTPTPSVGPVGTSFTLAGSGFGAYNGALTRLLIGGTTAAVSVWNDTTITGVAPTLAVGAQPVWIERLSGAGLESSNTVYFQVVAPAVASVVPSSGPIGVSFTLTGSGFGVYNGANTQVLLGGATIPISVWNDTTITGTVPGSLTPGSASVVVERIGTGGISFSSAAAFLVLAPGIASVSPASAPIGSAFTLTGAGFGTYNGANTQVLIGGTTTAISVWNDARIQGTVPALSAGTYDLLIERLQAGYASFSSSVAFTVTAPQVAAMTPSSAPIGAPFTLTGTSFGAYNGANTRVKFNGVVAPVSVWNDTTITGTVPGAVSSGPASVVVERAVGSGVASGPAPAFLVLVPTISTITPAFGPAGTAVTLNGFGFGPYAGASGTQLLVNGSTMPVAVWNDTLIRWTVPSSLANGTYPVVVSRTPAGGSVQSSSVPFTVGTSIGVSALFATGAVIPLSSRPDTSFQGDLNLPAAEGGYILTPSQAAVTVPPNALPADTEVTIARDKSQYKAARTAALSQTGLGAAGEPISFGPEGTQFTMPVTIELPYDPALVPDGQLNKIAIHYFDPASKTWTPLPTTLDAGRHVLIAQTSHFSLYQPLGQGIGVAAVDASFGLKAVYVFPNPVRGTNRVTIRVQPGQADSVEVHVYDTSGRKVHSSSDFTQSNVDDGNGLGTQITFDHVWDVSGVGSGVYTYVITARKAGNADLHKSGKVGVIK